ncbi:MAG: proline dehydrogenase family protein [Anaerolineales bacterium]|nr:proline dehydrogenase family protein [Anaerolineales bacterium]
MLRSLLIYLSQAAWARRIVTGFGIVRRMALRFVAGETLEDAVAVIQTLNAQGMIATLDHLGENVYTPNKTLEATQAILECLDAIAAADLQANVSVKLTQLGLGLDETLCAENMHTILTRAQQRNNCVRIDIEDFGSLDATVRIYRKLRADGFNNVGMAMQSYLYCAEELTAELLEEGTTFRLVKGAYKEPPDVAYPKKADVDANFDRLTALLLDASSQAGAPTLSEDGRFPAIPAIATHDEARIVFAKEYAAKLNLPSGKMEFQMLHGIRRDLQSQLVEEGYPVRIYVPFGTEWYPYFMRRLAERPANLWFIVSNFFRK